MFVFYLLQALTVIKEYNIIHIVVDIFGLQKLIVFNIIYIITIPISIITIYSDYFMYIY